MARLNLNFGRGRSGSGQAQPAAPSGRTQRPRRTPMGIADARASNNLLIGLGVGLITTVTGLSAAGTFTAINAMNRQSEEAIAEAERYQQELNKRQQDNLLASAGANAGNNGNDVTYSEDPATPPSQTPQQPVQVAGMTREEFLSQLPEQIQWMIEKHITYDEYGLPRDEFGSLMNDPTTDIYDPARWSYFFNSQNEEKEPKKEDLPTQGSIDESDPASSGVPVDENGRPVTPISELPVKAPDKTSGYEEGNYDPAAMPIENPAVEQPAGGNNGDNSGGNGSDPGSGHGSGTPSAPVVEQPGQGNADWWKGTDGKPLDGLTVDDNGAPYYVAAPGDTVEGVSEKYGFEPEAVAEVNDIEIVNPTVLPAGDIVRFPEEGPTKPVPGSSGNTGASGQTGGDWWKGTDGKPLDGLSVGNDGEPYYVVAPGDSLGAISGKYGFTVSDIVAANGIVNPNVLNVGDVIRFPEGGPTKPVVKNPNVDTGTNNGNGGSTGNTDGVTTGNASGGSAVGLG